MEGERIFNLFEGVCPDCGSDVEITEVGGTEEFLRDYQFDGYHEINEWSGTDSDGLGSIGSVTFKCSGCSREHYVENTGPVGGYDWV